jgi:hypothetical protein
MKAENVATIIRVCGPGYALLDGVKLSDDVGSVRWDVQTVFLWPKAVNAVTDFEIVADPTTVIVLVRSALIILSS